MRQGIFCCLFLLYIVSASADAQLRMAGIFTDRMVLQRDMPVPVWGWGEPGEEITVLMGNQEQKVVCEQTGRWEVKLNPISAGGPFIMKVIGQSDELELHDILIGDVWICSGQSNMWRPVSEVNGADREMAGANYPVIRLFAFPRTLSAEPADDILPPHPDEAGITSMKWEVCNPENIKEFSAVAYFFGKHVHETLDVPVGLLWTCWGNTKVESWTSLGALEESSYYPHIREHLINPVKVLDSVTHAYTSRIDNIEYMDEGMKDGYPIWAEPNLADRDWKTMMLPAAWEMAGLKDLDGIVWFRKDVFIEREAYTGDIFLSLDRVIDKNQVWVNGEYIGENSGRIPGSPYYASQPESKYTVPEKLLKPGRNTIAVRVINYAGNGGISGNPLNIFLKSESAFHLLAGPWKYKVGLICDTPPPRRVRPHQYPTVLYNGMIHPLIPMAIKGVIWYQGESNTVDPVAYRELFPNMIRDWRARWGQGDFPFIFVQLANFGDPAEDPPAQDNWALLREAQSMALSEPNTGMAVTIDIGEADNIHPRNKQDVGYRLALAALNEAYEKEIVYSGPVFKSMSIEGDQVRLTFTHTGSGLVLKDRYGYARGFALAGADRKFHWGRGFLDGDSLVLYSPEVKDPVAVRYAWSKNPEDANLCNREGLPAVPFRTDGW